MAERYTYTEDGYLDPKCLTPEGLYRLQSETEEHAVMLERERILKELMNNDSWVWHSEKTQESLIKLVKNED